MKVLILASKHRFSNSFLWSWRSVYHWKGNFYMCTVGTIAHEYYDTISCRHTINTCMPEHLAF